MQNAKLFCLREIKEFKEFREIKKRLIAKLLKFTNLLKLITSCIAPICTGYRFRHL